MSNNVLFDNGYIQVEFSNGETYNIPIYIIAQQKAEYYSTVDGIDYDDCYYIICHEFYDDFNLVKEWATSNMNWEDIKDRSIRVENSKSIDYEDEWCNAKFSFVEKM